MDMSKAQEAIDSAMRVVERSGHNIEYMDCTVCLNEQGQLSREDGSPIQLRFVVNCRFGKDGKPRSCSNSDTPSDL